MSCQSRDIRKACNDLSERCSLLRSLVGPVSLAPVQDHFFRELARFDVLNIGNQATHGRSCRNVAAI